MADSAKKEEKNIHVGDSCFTKDELVKMGFLYVLILVIAFIM